MHLEIPFVFMIAKKIVLPSLPSLIGMIFDKINSLLTPFFITKNYSSFSLTKIKLLLKLYKL